MLETEIPNELTDKNDVGLIEKALLSLIINSTNSDEIFYYSNERIKAKDFINKFHGQLYTLVAELVTKEVRIDKNILNSKIKGVKNQAQLTELLETKHSEDNLNFYIEEISNASKKRTIKSVILDASMRLQTQPDVKAVDLASIIEDQLVEVVGSNEFDFTTPGECLPSLLEKIRSGKHEIAMHSGFAKFDQKIGGFPNDVIIIGARPGMAKTELAMQIAIENAIKYGKRSLIFSLEMDPEMLTMRALSHITEIPFKNLIRSKLTIDETKRLESYIPLVSDLPIHIDRSPVMSIGQIIAKSKRAKIKWPDLAAIFIDYLQIMSTSDEDNPNQGLTKISNGLVHLRRLLKIPVFGISQLSRACELRPDKRPMASDLRESGSLEQAAAMILMLYRDGVYNDQVDPGLTELIIRKNRHGEGGTFNLYNHMDIQKLVEVGSEENSSMDSEDF